MMSILGEYLAYFLFIKVSGKSEISLFGQKKQMEYSLSTPPICPNICENCCKDTINF